MRPTLGRILGIACVAVPAVALLAGRPFLFTHLKVHAERARGGILSEPLDLSRPGTFTWTIRQNDWHYKSGLARLDLELERQPEPGEQPFSGRSFDLELEVVATATATRGPYPESEGVVTDRLVRSAFFPSNRPIKIGDRVWAGWHNDRLEYILASIVRVPYEDLEIEVRVIAGDEIIAASNPRLRLRADHDGAVPGHLGGILLVADAVMVLALLCLAVLAIRVWRE